MLRFWRRCSYAALAGLGAFCLMLFAWLYTIFMGWLGGGWNDENMDGELDTMTNAQGIFECTLFVTFTTTIATIWTGAIWWLLSLKVAAVLAEDSVTEVVKSVTLESVESDELFYPQVFKPCMGLARKHLPLLSAGWGRGAAFACLIAWAASLSKFCRFLNKLHDPYYIAEEGELAPFVRNLIPAMLYSIGPILVIMDLAAVSTMCDKLMDRINLVSTECTSVDDLSKVHERTYPLLTCMKELNTGQGLGFCVFTVVVDKKTLNKLALAVLSTFATLVPIILALQPTPKELVDSTGSKLVDAEPQCILTSQQLAGLRTMIAAVVGQNASMECSWNITVNEILHTQT